MSIRAKIIAKAIRQTQEAHVFLLFLLLQARK